MSDSTIDDQEIVLRDNWPGPEENRGCPYDWFTSSAARHNVTLANSKFYPLGAKKALYCPGNKGNEGWATFIYLSLAPVTEAPPTAAAKQVVVPVDANNIYKVTNDPDQCIIADGSLFAAVLLSAMTPTYDSIEKRGWFWCGGVCPVDYVSDLGGTYATAVADVGAGSLLVAANLSADAMGFGVCGADTKAVIGMALAADD